jgi:hypothetical protein
MVLLLWKSLLNWFLIITAREVQALREIELNESVSHGSTCHNLWQVVDSFELGKSNREGSGVLEVRFIVSSCRGLLLG